MSLDVLLPVGLILLFGMPHGAADGAIALSLYRDRARIMLFIAGYVLLALAVIVLWAFAPSLFLGGFLYCPPIISGKMTCRAITMALP